MTGPAISLREVNKKYGKLQALKNLTLEVNPGEVFGFLGLNGAGKTTTIRILLDLLRPDSGSASIMGFDCRRQGLEARSLVGYLPGETDIYGEMAGRDFLELMAGLNPDGNSSSCREDLLELLKFPAADLSRKLREYSTGMKRKLGLVQAFQGRPPLLILDEPTEGLDPLMQEAFCQLLHRTRAEGRSVFMSSHVLSEVERVCDRIGLIRNGELALLASVEELRSMAHRSVTVTFGADVPPAADKWPAGHEILGMSPRCWRLRIQGSLAPLLSRIAPLPVADLDAREPRLEEVLLRYFQKDPE
jgi:ABC-2 type transport system ATP-binding protein